MLVIPCLLSYLIFNHLFSVHSQIKAQNVQWNAQKTIIMVTIMKNILFKVVISLLFQCSTIASVVVHTGFFFVTTVS